MLRHRASRFRHCDAEDPPFWGRPVGFGGWPVVADFCRCRWGPLVAATFSLISPLPGETSCDVFECFPATISSFWNAQLVHLFWLPALTVFVHVEIPHCIRLFTSQIRHGQEFVRAGCHQNVGSDRFSTRCSSPMSLELLWRASLFKRTSLSG